MEPKEKKEKITEKLSAKQKLWIGIGIVVLLAVICAVGCYFLKMRLFEKNQRFTLKYVQIVPPPGYVSSYWNSELHRSERCRKLMEELNLNPEGKPINLFDVNLQDIHDRTLQQYSEIESVEVRRVLPDTLEFVIRERVPVANIGPGSQKGVVQIGGNKQKANRYLDDSGVVLSGENCQNAVLPMIIDFSDKEIANLKPGDRTQSSAIRLALDFIDLVTTNAAYKDIVIRTILLVEHQRAIQCNILYKSPKDKKEYVVIMPYPISKEKLNNDFMGRLIPALEKLRLRPEEKYTVDLQYDGQAVIKIQK